MWSVRTLIEETKLLIWEKVELECLEKLMLMEIFGLFSLSAFNWNDQKLTFLF